MNQPASIAALGRPTSARWVFLLYAAALSLILYLDRICIAESAGAIGRELGMDDVQRGWMFTAFTLGYMLFEIPSGWIGDRFGARNTLIRIVLWWSLFTALTGSIYPTPDSTLAFGLLIVFSQSSAVAPFIYTLF